MQRYTLRYLIPYYQGNMVYSFISPHKFLGYESYTPSKNDALDILETYFVTWVDLMCVPKAP